jgi:hypothetical protein
MERILFYDMRALELQSNELSAVGRELLTVARKWPMRLGNFAQDLRNDIERNGTQAVAGIVRFYAKWGNKHG